MWAGGPFLLMSLTDSTNSKGQPALSPLNAGRDIRGRRVIGVRTYPLDGKNIERW